MNATPAFGKRRIGLERAARSGDVPIQDRDSDRLVQAYQGTEDYARNITTRQRSGGFVRLRRGLMVGGAGVFALTLAWPFLGINLGSDTMMTAQNFESMTPAQLAELAPAAGGNQEPGILRFLMDKLGQ